ncbi:SERTA domain-containing protein 2 isoform X2 [Brachyhypopomus gauderio]
MQHVTCVGLKRKLAPEDARTTESEPKMAAVAEQRPWLCCVQRQVVLQLSLQKLCCSAPHAETALVRRVLIANTLRLLRDELGQQGAPLGPSGTAEGSREAEPQSRGEGTLTPAWVLEQDGEAFLSRHCNHDLSPPFVGGTPPPSSLTPDSFSWALAEIEDLFSAAAATGDYATPPTCPLSASSPSSSSISQPEHRHPLDPGSKLTVPATQTSEKQTRISSGAIGPAPCEPHLDSSHHANLCSPAPFVVNHTPLSIMPPSSSFLPDLSLDDFLFSDLDNFLCEFNPCSSNLSPTPNPSPKVTSMVTDDIMEHIMEVLVGS